MRIFWMLIIALLMTSTSISVQAIGVTTIYETTLPVPSQSPQDKNRAILKGFEQVLIKASGNPQIMSNPSIKNNMKNAQQIVEKLTYSDLGKNNSKGPQPYRLTILFKADSINHLLENAGASVWSNNRPLVVAWIVREAEDHPPEIIDSNTRGELQNLIKRDAEQRGLPLILPMMDVTDINQVTPEDITSMTATVLQKAAKRYGSDAILIGRIVQTDTEFNTQWRLEFGDDQWSWDIPGKTLTEALNTAIGNVADALASRFAVVISKTVQSRLVLKIKGIGQQGDLLRLMQYLQHFNSVAEVQLAQVKNDEVTLNVSLRSNKQAFTEMIALGKILQPVAGETDEDTLLYRLVH